MPGPWLEATVGTSHRSGDASLSGGIYSLSGSGELASARDTFRFAHQPVQGDDYVVARLVSVNGPAKSASKSLTSGRAGVMIRQGLTSNARFASMSVDAAGVARFEFRLSDAGAVYSRTISAAPNGWMKLERIRNALIGSVSADGVTWTQAAFETIPMAADATVGLWVTSGSTSNAFATFSDVVVPQNIVRYGASATLANNVPAIHAAIAASANSGNVTYVPPGVFQTSQVIELGGGKRLVGIGAFGVNPRSTDQVSTLLSTNSAAAPVRLSGVGSSIANLKLDSTYTGPRLTADRTTAVYADTAASFSITSVEVARSASGGIMISHGARDGVVRGNRVHDTLADGIHVTNGSQRILIEHNVVYRTGDDLIATVGYNGKFDAQGNQWPPPTDITIRHNDGNNTGMTHGRGIAAVGAKNVLIDDNTITNAAHTGIIIVSENAYNSLAGDGITVTRNRIVNPNTQNLSGATGNHGGIYIGGRSGFPITDVTIGDLVDPALGNTITNAKGSGINVAPFTANIRIGRNTIDTVTGYGLRVYDSSTVAIANNVIRRPARHGIYLHNANSGAFSITGNVLQDVNTSNAAGNDAIYVAPGGAYASLSIASNAFTNPGGYVVDRFIQCHFAAASVLGNTTNTGKSIYVGP